MRFVNFRFVDFGKTGHKNYFFILNKKHDEKTIINFSLREKCPYSEFLWFVFSRIWTEYEDLLPKSPYSLRMWESADQKNS